MQNVIRLLFISSEVLLIFLFLPLSHCRKNRLFLLPVYAAVFVLVTTAGPQDPLYTIVGMVVLRLIIFTALIFSVFDFPLKRCVNLAMTYFLLTQPARRIIAAIFSFCTLYVPDVEAQILGPNLKPLLILALQLFVLWVSRRWNPELEIMAESPLAAGQSILLLGLYLYVRYNDKYWGFSVTSRPFDLFMVIIVYAAIIFATFLTVHLLIAQRQEQFQREILLRGQQQYHAVMEQMRSDSSIRCMYHDLRKHLDALSALSGDQGEVRQYLQSMTQVVDKQLPFVDTGDPMLDAILSQKLRDAASENISANIYVDFRQGDFIAPIDKVAIFSNIMDNAVEAVRLVSDPAKRKIILKASVQRGAVLISCSNYYTGTLRSEDDRLLTTKTDSSMHGIGISSIRHSATKYEGTVNIAADADRFTITVFIPLPTA